MNIIKGQGKGCGAQRHFQQYFSYILAVSFIGSGNQSTRRYLLTFRKLLTNLSQYYIEYTSSERDCQAWLQYDKYIKKPSHIKILYDLTKCCRYRIYGSWTFFSTVYAISAYNQ